MPLPNTLTIDLNDAETAWAYKLLLAAWWLHQGLAWQDMHGNRVELKAAVARILAQTGARRGQWGPSESLLTNPSGQPDTSAPVTVQQLGKYWQPTYEGARQDVWNTNYTSAVDGWSKAVDGVAIPAAERNAYRHYFDPWWEDAGHPDTGAQGAVVPTNNTTDDLLVIFTVEPTGTAGSSASSSSGMGALGWLLTLGAVGGAGYFGWRAYKKRGR